MSKKCLATRELEIHFRYSRHRRYAVLTIYLANLLACLYLAILWWPALCLGLPWFYGLRSALVDPLAGRCLMQRGGHWYLSDRAGRVPLLPLSLQLRIAGLVCLRWRALDGHSAGSMFIFADACEAAEYRRLRCRLAVQG